MKTVGPRVKQTVLNFICCDTLHLPANGFYAHWWKWMGWKLVVQITTQIHVFVQLILVIWYNTSNHHHHHHHLELPYEAQTMEADMSLLLSSTHLQNVQWFPYPENNMLKSITTMKFKEYCLLGYETKSSGRNLQKFYRNLKPLSAGSSVNKFLKAYTLSHSTDQYSMQSPLSECYIPQKHTSLQRATTVTVKLPHTLIKT